ncbi:MAG: DUF241 domain-containing protein [Chloracidobacterium sp.]|nr:DUF241 domain-containing protein [Chloracidobacterium sp.]
MADLDQNPIPAEDIPERPAAVEEVTLAIPPNRPRKVYDGMWGPLEIGAVTAGVLAMLMAFVLYFFWVVPSNRELARNKSEADRLDAELISAKSKYGDIQDTQTQVDKLVGSVDDFETRFLPMQTNGQAALYQRLNGLIRAYGLENTTGPDYAPLEGVDVDQAKQTDEEKGRTKFRSLYPGVYVTTTVEGSYQNLRRFIREIETGREFVVISSVELAPSDSETKKEGEPNAQPAQADVNPTVGVQNAKGGFAQPAVNPNARTAPQQDQRSSPKGKTRGEVVALRIEMAAYFRRPGFVPMPSTPAEQ